MSWQELTPGPASGQAKRGSAVTIALRVNERFRPVLMLTLRGAMMDGLEFIRRGARVSVMLGHGEHAGMLRIVPGDTFVCGRTGGKRVDDRTVVLRIPVPPGVPLFAHDTVAVEHEWNADWIEATLPDFARPKATPSASLPTVAPAKQPHVPLSSRVPDPAALGRVEARKGRS